MRTRPEKKESRDRGLGLILFGDRLVIVREREDWISIWDQRLARLPSRQNVFRTLG